jgi:alpha-L-rhamnosidase
MIVDRLRVNDLPDPLGIGTDRPELSWVLRSDRKSQRQSAYEIQVADDAEFTEMRWESGRVDGDFPRAWFGGPALPGRTRAYWRVRVWNADNERTGWSRPGVFETGLLDASDWAARWITHPDWVDADAAALPVLRREFPLDSVPRRARLYLSGVGIYTATVNGKPITDAVLEPPYSNFASTVDYTVCDVTDLLVRGQNEIRIALGTGIAHVTKPADRYTKLAETIARPRAIAQLELDGVPTIRSDESWQVALGPTTQAHWYGGEDHDAGRTPQNWTGAALLDWNPALTARSAPPIRIVEEIAAVGESRPAEGIRVFDLGVNIAGWPRVQLDSPAGKEISIWPAELLGPDGRISQRHSGEPTYDRYTTTGGDQSWHPQFVYHGFRYLQITGLTGEARVDGLVLRADNEKCGEFTCSDELLTSIHRVIDRAAQGNMFSVLTDCPHREKLGWLEQIHLLFDLVSRGYDVRAYYRDLVRRVAEAQTADGLVPDIAPEFVVFKDGFRDDPNWGAAIILAPWEMYRAFADVGTLRTYYPAMVRYARYLQAKSENHILDYGLGDWITLDESTPLAIAATWGYQRAIDALAGIAEVIGADAAEFRGLADDIKAQFHRTFFDGIDSYGSGSQACDAFALDIGAVPAELRDTVTAHLVRSIADAGDHLTVGEIALPAVFRVLSSAGHDELIYRIATRTDSPSYGFQLAAGATALTEAWDGPTRGLSQNHFMLGAIDSWFTGGLAGIGQADDSIAYRHAVIRPAPVGDLTAAAATIPTPYGPLRSAWSRADGEFRLTVDIPVGVEADVIMPNGRRHAVGSGEWEFSG